MKRDILIYRGLTAVLVMGALVTAAGVKLALADDPPQPQNIIVIMADDLDWTDLPFFNPPVQWANPDNPDPNGDPWEREAGLRLPALNRLAARMFAGPASSSLAPLGDFDPDPGTPGDEYAVVPIDLNSGDADNFDYTVDGITCTDSNPLGCDPVVDILSGYGGLKKLAGGVTFERFYSSSAVCSPARASFLTGRHPDSIGVPQQSTQLESGEATVAEFLKQGCTLATDRQCVDDFRSESPSLGACPCYMDPIGSTECSGGPCDCADAPCYTTGAVGKWHLGSKTKKNMTPWQQGFDEYVGLLGKWRDPFGGGNIDCSPNTQAKCCSNDVTKSCTSDPECSGGTCQFGLQCTGLYIGDDAGQTQKCTVAPSVARGDVDCCEPRSKGQKGQYKFSHKSIFDRDTKNDWPCSDNRHVRLSGCRYSTKWMRDHAKDFILRHQDDARPFFLFVAFTATHFPYAAPNRTLAHYHTDGLKPREPNARDRYWAMLEELDAAVGQIVEVVDDDDINPSVKNNTWIFFTSDHGRSGSSYGNPWLRGGKTNVYESGVRVGMLARGSTTFPATAGLLEDATVGDYVDLFSTIAHLAGYNDLNFGSTGTPSAFDANGRLKMRMCDTNDANDDKPCGGNASVCGDPSDCADRYVHGVSLVPVLRGQTTWKRDYVFASYKNDTRMITAREGYFTNASTHAVKICGYDGQKLDGSRLVRTHRGASCTTCVDDTTCTGLSAPDDGVACEVLGKVCVPKAKVDDCREGAGGDPPPDNCPDLLDYPRCRVQGDCPKDTQLKYKCTEGVRTECNKCLTTAWKLRGKPGNRELYDLASNPEENDKNFKNESPRINCLVSSCSSPPPGSDDEKLCAVEDELGNRLENWKKCVAGDCNGVICEDAPATDPGTTNACGQ